MSIPRKPRRRSQEGPSNQEKEPKLEIVEKEPEHDIVEKEHPHILKEINEIIQRLENGVQEERMEKGSYFEDPLIKATSSHAYVKEVREELHTKEDLKKITNLIDEIRDSKIIERYLKKENKMYRANNNKMAKENKKLEKQVKNLETQNMLISRKAYRRLKEKKLWQYKYEKKKVKVVIYKAG